jgi:hypothetical protein
MSNSRGGAAQDNRFEVEHQSEPNARLFRHPRARGGASEDQKQRWTPASARATDIGREAPARIFSDMPQARSLRASRADAATKETISTLL